MRSEVCAFCKLVLLVQSLPLPCVQSEAQLCSVPACSLLFLISVLEVITKHSESHNDFNSIHINCHAFYHSTAIKSHQQLIRVNNVVLQKHNSSTLIESLNHNTALEGPQHFNLFTSARNICILSTVVCIDCLIWEKICVLYDVQRCQPGITVHRVVRKSPSMCSLL